MIKTLIIDGQELTIEETQAELLEVARQGPPGPPGQGAGGSATYGGGSPINEQIASGDTIDAALNKLQGQTDTKLDIDGGTMNGPLGMNDAPVFGAKTISFNGELDCGLSGAAKTITLNDSQKQRITLSAATPILTIDPSGAGVGHYQVRIIQDATGSRAPSFAGLSANRWLGSAAAPAVNAAANGESVLTLYWDGTHFIQSLTKVGAA